MPSSKNLKILFVTSEVVPFVKTGGLADVASSLPQALYEMGHQIRIVVPKYGAIDERKFKIHEVVRLKDLETEVAGKKVNFSINSSFLVGSKARVQIYFLDNQEYFGSRHSLYEDPITGKDFADNDERFILLARSVFELIERLGWVPDIIHCNDWQTALIPAYLKEVYKDREEIQNIKTVLTIHNLSYQGIFPKSSFAKTGFPKELNSNSGILHKNKLNFLKVGAQYADVITTVSENYAKEICTSDDVASGLKEPLCNRKEDLIGILNGIDVRKWNPEKDRLIPKRYTIKNLKNKEENKKALAQKFGFEYNPDKPVVAMISRLYDFKGIDLIKKAFASLMKMDINFVLLGTGERKYHEFFESKLMKHSGQFSCFLGFDDQLAHLIEAGSDIYLMPSKFEPCGLNQMYSLNYGTIPVVRATGGLADTVQDFNPKTGKGNGFVFNNYDHKEMLSALERAVDLFKTDKSAWQKLMKEGMKTDFSWHNSAKKYVDLYKKVLK
ncbi:MAG: glycogen synthase GlgA [Ignavibacteria bacterium]|nr:MAG: glycogen synthase GlgA [Ignavibacteria bacterium]